MRQKFNSSPRCSAEEYALECATQEARFRKIRSCRLKPEYESVPAVQWPIDRVVNAPISTSDLEFSELFCRAQRRTEIAEFVIDLVRSFDGLSNFFAEQRAIAFT